MNQIMKGKAHIFGNNIDTDQICPGKYLSLTDPKEIASHCLEGADETFVNKFTPGDLVVAGTNFGCGSSREHAAISFLSLGVGALIAKSYARIFFRNAVNLGVLPIVCQHIDDILTPECQLEINIEKLCITNVETGESVACEPISQYIQSILEAGGIKPLMLQKN